MNLVIVESPTKAKTISRFLSRDYTVKSSYGHIRDLPEKKLGVDVKKDFEPTYVIPAKAKSHINDLKKTAAKSANIILATDGDREGEAIAWHLTHALELSKGRSKNIERIVFHEITKRAIEEALQNPRTLDLNLVDAQQARRILDRLVGYKLSPFLWRKVAKGLSAGRVQSVAVRFVVEREREIEKFKPEEYWTIEGLFKKIDTGEEFVAKLLKKKEDKNLPPIKNGEEADSILKELEGSSYFVDKIDRKELRRFPLPPFTTSTLQQEAARRLGFSAKQTMMMAQQLYEGVELGSEGSVGLITYMRTDSLNLSEDSIRTAAGFIQDEFGNNYLAQGGRRFKTKSKNAQEAHEAIRPTDPARMPEKIKGFLDNRQLKVYGLIWRRFIASQMKEALFDATAADIQSTSKTPYTFRANGSILKFDGFLKVYPSSVEDILLPELKEKEGVNLDKLTPTQHFTQPPPRYTEATLIKALEKYGIGRPSTYAPTMSTIQDRQYVEKDEQKKLRPTEIGTLVNDILVEHFPEIVDIQFTANMEEDLDKIARGEQKWVPVLRNFYDPFKDNLAKKEKELTKKELTEQATDEVCEKCGKPMVIKMGRFGKFLACSGYPECKNTRPLDGDNRNNGASNGTDEKCDLCGAPMQIKRGRFGAFLGCSRYPECKGIKKIEKSTGITCPECSKGQIVEKRSKRGKIFYACNQYPACQFALWQKPTGEKCPECGSLLVMAGRSGEKLMCNNKGCEYNKKSDSDKT